MIKMFSTKEQAWLKTVAESSGAKINDSAIFLSLFTEGYKKDPVALLQFSIAIIENKPLFFVVEEGTELKDGIKRLAHGIEYYKKNEKGSVERATDRILKKAERMGFFE